jgi:5'-nucleotidase
MAGTISETAKQMTIAVSAGSLFDMREDKRIFIEQGQRAYEEHMRAHENNILPPGAAMRFVQKLNRFNKYTRLSRHPVRIVLYTGNNQISSMRILQSIEEYNIEIHQAAVLSGQSRNISLLGKYEPDLYLTSNPDFAALVQSTGIPAAVMGPPCAGNCSVTDDDLSPLHIAYDFDGVLGDQSADILFAEGGAEKVRATEKGKALSEFADGPHMKFLMRLAWLQSCMDDANGADLLKLTLITARNFGLASRVLRTINGMSEISWENMFFMDGEPKWPILQEIKPDIYFDDSSKEIGMAQNVVNSARIVNGWAAPTMSDRPAPRPEYPPAP